jgi:uncharacterized protein (TIGR03083 family)
MTARTHETVDAVPDDVQLRTTANRRVIARLFAELDDDQLGTPSLCTGWTCRDVLGHLVMSVDLTFSGSCSRWPATGAAPA